MTTQPTFFALHSEPLAKPLPARNTDPITSHQSASKMVESGAAKKHAEMIVDLVFRKPGLTSHELEDLSKQVHGDGWLTNQQINRRLSEAGDVSAPDDKHRKCACLNKRCARHILQTWWPQ